MDIILDADIYDSDAIEVEIVTGQTITFTQKHLAEIQLTLEYQENLD